MDINLTQLQNLIHIAENAAIDELEVNDGVQNIRIVCRAPTQPTVPTMPMAHAHQGSVSAMNPMSMPSPASSQSVTESATDSTVAQKPEPIPTAQAASQDTINAPMLGTFYLRANPESAPFVTENATVTVNQTLCIIEAMKIMHEVKAEKAGKITQILATEGEMVEYDQSLFVIE